MSINCVSSPILVSSRSEIIQEGLHEGLLDIFTNYSLSNPGNNAKFFELAEKALKCYPNNAFFLNTVYSCEVSIMKQCTYYFMGNINVIQFFYE